MALKDIPTPIHWAITTLGLEFAVSEVLGVGIGFWLDKKYGSSPWCLLAGAVAGFMLGMYIVWRRAKDMERHESEKKNERR